MWECGSCRAQASFLPIAVVPSRCSIRESGRLVVAGRLWRNDRPRDGERQPPLAKVSDFELLRDANGALKLGAKMSHSAAYLGLTRQELNRTKIDDLAIDQRRLGAPQRGCRGRPGRDRSQLSSSGPIARIARLLHAACRGGGSAKGRCTRASRGGRSHSEWNRARVRRRQAAPAGWSCHERPKHVRGPCFRQRDQALSGGRDRSRVAFCRLQD